MKKNQRLNCLILGGVILFTASSCGENKTYKNCASNIAPINNTSSATTSNQNINNHQIMIEAMLVETIPSKSGGSFGVQWLSGTENSHIGSHEATSNDTNNTTTVSGAVVGTLTNATSNPSSAQYASLDGTVESGSTTVGGQIIPSLESLADMMSKNGANILFKENIVATNNTETSVFVGANIGMLTSDASNSECIARQDIGITLKIKPTIIKNDIAQLDISLDNISLDPSSKINNVPSFFKSKLQTMMVVNNGQIIDAGEFSGYKTVTIQKSIPIIDKIPYIGKLFTWQKHITQRTKLDLFLRPIIMQK